MPGPAPEGRLIRRRSTPACRRASAPGPCGGSTSGGTSPSATAAAAAGTRREAGLTGMSAGPARTAPCGPGAPVPGAAGSGRCQACAPKTGRMPALAAPGSRPPLHAHAAAWTASCITAGSAAAAPSPTGSPTSWTTAAARSRPSLASGPVASGLCGHDLGDLASSGVRPGLAKRGCGRAVPAGVAAGGGPVRQRGPETLAAVKPPGLPVTARPHRAGRQCQPNGERRGKP